MPTYAIIGATGNTGTALIEQLSQDPAAHIRAFCRDKNKLLKASPYVLDSKRVEVFEGSIDDVELLAQCIQGARAVFHVVSTNTNVPDCHVGLDTAKGIVGALNMIEAVSWSYDVAQREKLPKIVLLSSATIEDHLSKHTPVWLRAILLRSASNVYEDLRQTEAFLRTHGDRITTIFIKPGGLSVDKQRGHRLDMNREESFISYLDLAAAMLEAANDESGQYDMRNVSVVNSGGSAKLPSGTPWCILTGLLRHYFPFAHPYLPTPGPA
ncbi:stcQ [Colletotrichum scovillei]|uniref:stcQ n=1 Tax=Colletotrichum scovillei TaxID=1209932 RepID=UPI0015C304AF|nr:stcQ [Colletotrichum scovillei]KAF4772809.1 stcQ [Colletotrichum scovillei]